MKILAGIVGDVAGVWKLLTTFADQGHAGWRARELFEIDPYGLIEQAALEILVLGLFGESLEAEESGRIAFLNGYFQVARRIEKRQLFSFPYVGVGFADLVDDFVPFEYDAKAAAFAAFFELLPCDIDDDILEMVDKDDLSFDPAIAKYGAEMIFLGEGRVGDADVCQAAAVGQLENGAAHNTGAVEGIFDGGLVQGQADDHFGAAFQDHSEQAIVGAEQVLVIVISQEQLFGLFFEHIDQDQVVGVRWKVLDGIPADIGCLRVVEGGKIVRDIQYGECRVDLR